MIDHLHIQSLPLRDLVPDKRNARRHGSEQIKKIRASLARYGWTNPILIGSGRKIIAGHARYAAAVAMAEDKEPIANNADASMAPTVDLSHLTKTEQRAYALADNRIAEDAAWDRELLQLEVRDLSLDGFDLGLTGFSDVQLEGLLGTTQQAESKLTSGLKYQVIIECEGEVHQAQLLQEMRDRKLPARPLIL